MNSGIGGGLRARGHGGAVFGEPWRGGIRGVEVIVWRDWGRGVMAWRY